MLPRVSAALAKFLSPVTSSPSKSSPLTENGESEEKPFKRFKKEEDSKSESKQKKDPQKKDRPTLKLVSPPEPLKPDQSSGQNFLQLFSAFQEQKATLIRWLGTRTYTQTSKEISAKGKFRKGSMFDRED